jgi:hypothetical protein
MTTLLFVSYAALWLVVGVQGFAFLEIVKQIATIRKQIPPPRPLVMPAALEKDSRLKPLTALSAASLQPAAWSHYFGNGLNVALFLTPRCSHCYALALDIGDYFDQIHRQVGVVVVLRAPRAEGQRFIESTGIDPVYVALDPDGSTAEALGIRAWPMAVVITADRIGHGAVVNDVEQLEGLIERGLIKQEDMVAELSRGERDTAHSIGAP